MSFDPTAYGEAIAAILALDGNGERLMPLAAGKCSSEEAERQLKAASPKHLFPNSRSPETAMAGLWLYFCGYDQAHALCQDLETPDAAFWHGILHRQEPDATNAAYWFRRVGPHPVFPQIRDSAAEVLARHSVPLRLKDQWDPFAFIDFCAQARHQADSVSERAALEIQRAEWQILFDYCARPQS